MVTNLFKQTNLKITFRPTNTTYQQLSSKLNNTNSSGIYQLKCDMCNNAYIGQSGSPITIRHREYLRYIRSDNPTSAYTIHILSNRHELVTAEEMLRLLKPCNKGTRMNCWETLFMQIYHKHNTFIAEQQVTGTNPLFELAHTSRDLQRVPENSFILHSVP
jgi:hypothetical protein